MTRTQNHPQQVVPDDNSFRDTLSRDNSFAATVSVVNAYLHYNQCPAEKLPDLIRRVHDVLCEVQTGEQPGRGDCAQRLHPALQPAVPVDESIERDYIVCLEDGKRIRLLKRHLKNTYGMTPEQYRSRWGLPDDYPMVAPALSELRAKTVTQIKPHLGRSKRAKL